jgi:large subunit ribosomal protein L30
MDKKVVVKQTRSGNRCPKYQRDTLRALGLGKIGRERQHSLSPSVQGMITTVTHLVEVRAARQ